MGKDSTAPVTVKLIVKYKSIPWQSPLDAVRCVCLSPSFSPKVGHAKKGVAITDSLTQRDVDRWQEEICLPKEMFDCGHDWNKIFFIIPKNHMCLYLWTSHCVTESVMRAAIIICQFGGQPTSAKRCGSIILASFGPTRLMDIHWVLSAQKQFSPFTFSYC